ncbi:TPA: fimbrial protein [Salmonella enterica subsp. enterica serovar Nagoya]
MNSKFNLFTVLLLVCSSNAFADVPQVHGSVTFSGKVLSPTCQVSAGFLFDRSITLPPLSVEAVEKTKLNAPISSVMTPVDFKLECGDGAVPPQLRLTFKSDELGMDDAIVATGTGGGVNIALSSKDKDGKLFQHVVSGKPIPMSKDGNNYSLTLYAQPVRAGTPINAVHNLQPESGDILLSINNSPLSLMEAGFNSPQVVTPATCTIIGDRDKIVDFGDVQRDTGKLYTTRGNNLAQRNLSLLVRCTPAPQDGAKYQVSVDFNGELATEVPWPALKTNISDLFVTGHVDRVQGISDITFWDGHAITMDYSEDSGLFSLPIVWTLKNYRPTGVISKTSGNFKAVATYTVNVN